MGFKRILATNSPEWKAIAAGVVMAFISGGTWPTFAVLLGEVLKVTLNTCVENSCNRYWSRVMTRVMT